MSVLRICRVLLSRWGAPVPSDGSVLFSAFLQRLREQAALGYGLDKRARNTEATTSVSGTFETCRLHKALSALRGEAENICSRRGFQFLTRSGHLPALSSTQRCHPFLARLPTKLWYHRAKDVVLGGEVDAKTEVLCASWRRDS